MSTEENRCPRCGWPFAEAADRGCVPGNCSFRCACLDHGPEHAHGCPIRTGKETQPFYAQLQALGFKREVFEDPGPGFWSRKKDEKG